MQRAPTSRQWWEAPSILASSCRCPCKTRSASRCTTIPFPRYVSVPNGAFAVVVLHALWSLLQMTMHPGKRGMRPHAISSSQASWRTGRPDRDIRSSTFRIWGDGRSVSRSASLLGLSLRHRALRVYGKRARSETRENQMESRFQNVPLRERHGPFLGLCSRPRLLADRTRFARHCAKRTNVPY